jgi:hypothetical protein
MPCEPTKNEYNNCHPTSIRQRQHESLGDHPAQKRRMPFHYPIRFVVCAPPDLIQASRVVNSRNGMLVIAADNGAVAAKLRQLAPRLLKNLQKQRAQITGIQVQVQVGRGLPKPQVRTKKTTLPIDLIDSFDALSAKVKNPELRLALARFSTNRRNKR